MKTRNAFLPAFGAAAVLLAACGGGQPQTAPSEMVAQGSTRMDGGVTKQDLLYVSNSNGEVTVYNYAKRTLIGVLTKFTKPRGECADSAGNVYIADYTAKQIVEYAHGGTKPIKTLDDTPDSPYACAVDTTTGNLAVANDDGSSQDGNIAIWAQASGSPTTYADSQLYNFVGCAYDSSGNLLVSSAYRYGYPTAFAWLPKNGTKLIDVNVPGPKANWKWGGIEGIQWDGKFFAIDDYEIYRVSLIHGQAYYVGATELIFPEEENPEGPFAIYNAKPGSQGTQVVAGVGGDSVSAVAYWDYPTGGDSLYSFTHGVDGPFGVVVSLGQK